MIGYITLGSNNVATLAAFYDELFKELSIFRVFDSESFVAWGENADDQLFSIITPFNKEAATVGNGVMIAIKLPSKEKVTLMHRKAIELGAQDEGAPGLRQEGFYCGYIRDLEGNKINFYHKESENT